MKLNNKGFTLVEMIIVAAIFVVVIMITGDAFKTILIQTSKLYKSEESNIEGVVGLEMFRHDLEQAGFGLAESYDPAWPISYLEAGFLPANTYNDATSGIPRAFVAGNDLGVMADPNTYSGGVTYNVLPNTDYLAIKATSLGSNNASQKWTYLTYSSTGKSPKAWPGGNFDSSQDRVIMLRRTFQDTGYNNQLVYATGVTTPSSPNPQTIYWQVYNNNGFVSDYSPTQPNEIFYIYGISGSGSLRMPFNRADYFVAKPSVANKFPSTCQGDTGILYKATVNHADGKLTYMPILDCVADMQVLFGWNMTDSSGSVLIDTSNPDANNTTLGSGLVDTWSNADGSQTSGPASAAQVQTAMGNPGHVRTKLKVIKVYILAQNGKKDPNYTSPSTIAIGDPGEASLTKPLTAGNFNLTSDMLNYRWKLYRLVIKPKNLISNQ